MHFKFNLEIRCKIVDFSANCHVFFYRNVMFLSVFVVDEIQKCKIYENHHSAYFMCQKNALQRSHYYE